MEKLISRFKILYSHKPMHYNGTEYGKLHDIKNDIVDRLKCDKKD
jgi:hypothetical protein